MKKIIKLTNSKDKQTFFKMFKTELTDNLIKNHNNDRSCHYLLCNNIIVDYCHTQNKCISEGCNSGNECLMKVFKQSINFEQFLREEKLKRIINGN